MKICTILLGLCFLLEFNYSVGQTCDQIQHTTINDVRRSTKYKGKPGNLLCDRNYIQDDKWYRFDSVAGNKMPTRNPGTGLCGTHVPIWMRGTHPTTDNVVKNATACAAAPFVFPLGCGYSYAIKVIKCGNFFLYRLKEPQVCYLAYCAGDKLPTTNCSVTGETLPLCSGAIPRVTVVADFKHENSDYVRLRCSWEGPGNLTNVEYQARWFGDIEDVNPKLQAYFTGLDTPELLFEHKLSQGLPKTTGYEFNKNVYCAVRARYKTGGWSKWAASKRIYTGIEVFPTFIPIDDCGNKDREVIVTLRPHLPIRVNPVYVAIDSPKKNNKLIDEICVVGDANAFYDCGMVFQPGHRVGRPMRFKLMTNCATGDKSAVLDVTYQLKQSFFDFTKVNRFWILYEFPKIKIRKAKFVKRQCRSSGNPHFRTFDGKTYDFFGRGTFLLYKNTFYGTEIQVRQRACNGGTPSCNCGVAIKENLFYKIYDMCYVTAGRPWWENNVRSRLRTNQLRDFKFSRFYTKVTQQGSTTNFEVTLPSGVNVIVDRQSWGLNLNVWAPQDPGHPSEGLCGNNNGNPTDDFGRWHSAKQFGEDQRIRTRLTHFDYKGSKYEEEQIDDGCDKKICVCPRGGLKRCGGEAEAICFPNIGSIDARARHKGSGIGQCDSRPRRAVALEDDTVDDQDEIPV